MTTKYNPFKIGDNVIIKTHTKRIGEIVDIFFDEKRNKLLYNIRQETGENHWYYVEDLYLNEDYEYEFDR